MNPDQHITNTGAAIKRKASELGFGACGFAKAEEVDIDHLNMFKRWIAQQGNGKMQYMDNHYTKRANPSLLVPSALSVISLAVNYHQKDYQPNDTAYKVSQYATGIDYHHVVKEKLYQLLEFIKSIAGKDNARVFTDSAPVMERYWAMKAGLGGFGKNSCLIIPRKGSFFFLAEIICDLKLPYDEAFQKDMCGHCRKCMDACPTGAITESGFVDAPRCISYLTIELKDAIPQNMRPHLEKYIFGCDICQQVCPHNIKFASPSTEKGFEPSEAIAQWTNKEWETMEKNIYRKKIRKKGSPLSRVKYEKLMDNILAVKQKI